MGYDYALVHLYYTIPPAIILSLIYRPLFTPLAIYKILFLITIAVVATIPWDSYLIRHNVWSYPDDAIVGPTLFSIPAEELFFFVIQTYNTSLLYLILSLPTFHPVYLRGSKNGGNRLRVLGLLGAMAIAAVIWYGVKHVLKGGEGFYMGLIIVWAGPFILLLWSLAYQLIVNLPLSNTLIPIVLPTLYLWIVDTIALRRGTWVIESGTKLEIQIWRGLEIEEAVFFLVTNTLIVLGQIAFDNALAILVGFPALFPDLPSSPGPTLLIEALFTSISQYDDQRLQGFAEAISTLRRKSRSFYLASGVFQGRLRADLILLYSFCRVSDDLVDNASTKSEAEKWISKLQSFIDQRYAPFTKHDRDAEEKLLLDFPPKARSALRLLPTNALSAEPLYDLLKGFEMDLHFSSSTFPIEDIRTLQLYAQRVAGTVAESCIELVYHHCANNLRLDERVPIIDAGGRMGIALQLVNISRDISVDAALSRVYLPTSLLKEYDLSPSLVLKDPSHPNVEKVRTALLDMAEEQYRSARASIEALPVEARAPMRVAVESYMEIGRVLRTKGSEVKRGRATVPKWRRVKVAWLAMCR